MPAKRKKTAKANQFSDVREFKGRFRFAAVLPLIAALALADTAAAEMTARELLPMAREYVAANEGDGTHPYRAGFFAGYVRAAFEHGNGGAFCGPPCACESAESVADHLERHPDLLERPAREVVDAALAAKFPCKR
jgi:Ssp1 endopeptidase immunity protein Rap1a